MSFGFVRRSYQAAARYTGDHAGFGVDPTDDQLRLNVSGTRKIIPSIYTGDLTAASTLTGADSGGVFFLNSATEFTTTLPAVAAGLRYTFIVKAAPSGASYKVITPGANGGANIIKGIVIPADGAAGDTEATGGDTVNFVDGAAVAGDRAEFYCDGTNWFVTAFCAVATGVTITTTA